MSLITYGIRAVILGDSKVGKKTLLKSLINEEPNILNIQD